MKLIKPIFHRSKRDKAKFDFSSYTMKKHKSDRRESAVDARMVIAKPARSRSWLLVDISGFRATPSNSPLFLSLSTFLSSSSIYIFSRRYRTMRARASAFPWGEEGEGRGENGEGGGWKADTMLASPASRLSLIHRH